jgi:hypothetical protein
MRRKFYLINSNKILRMLQQVRKKELSPLSKKLESGK